MRLEHLLSGRKEKAVPDAARRKPSKSGNTSFLEYGREMKNEE